MEWRKQILDMQDRLKHPTDYLDVLCLNLFDVFCDFLKSQRYMGKNKLEYALTRETRDSESPKVVQHFLTKEANDDKFLQYLNDLIVKHMSEVREGHSPYIFIYGMGQMFPYLRTNILLTRYEKYNKSDKYKIIVFYPGKTEGTKFKLFGVLNEDHTYRAHKLIKAED